jgi:TetR/AcrR family transcriptional regulator
VPAESPSEPPQTSTRQRLLDSALELFSGTSFTGVSIRDIERHAEVERGLLAYHFGSKDALWRAVVDSIYDPFVVEMGALARALRDVSPRERAKALRKSFVRFNARHPEFFRLLVLEGLVRTERTVHLESKIRHGSSLYYDMLGLHAQEELRDVILRFVLLGASAAPFIFPAFQEPLLDALGSDGRRASAAEFLEPYAEAVADLTVHLDPRNS